MERRFKVAGHVFAIVMDASDDLWTELTQYDPFSHEGEGEPVFRLTVTNEPLTAIGFVEEVRQEDEGQQIVAGHIGTKPCFEFCFCGKRAARLITTEDYAEGTVFTENKRSFGLNNAIMVLYALATATRQTALFHSSVVSYRDKAYMFLGKSGTGKSTHSSLWLRHIEGTELVNDDNPVVRVEHGQATVYGSPWSGKTPCYRNVSYPVGAIVRLAQAPENKMRRLRPIEAYAALMPSISGKRWDKMQAEGLHETENLLAGIVPIYHLDCLPDEAAAQLSCKTCTHEP